MAIKRDYRSDNKNARRTGCKPEMIIIHAIGLDSEEDCLKLLCGQPFVHEGREQQYDDVSAHYVIVRDGTVQSLVDEEDCAWHAGVSYWRGRRNLNQWSVGIELTRDKDWHFTKAQMEATMDLCDEIVARWNMDGRYILAHSDIAPTRKIDPGAFFDWRGLAARGLGVMPRGEATDKNIDWRQCLRAIGYQPASLKKSLEAFQRHYMMMHEMHSDFGQPTEATCAALYDVRRLFLKN